MSGRARGAEEDADSDDISPMSEPDTGDDDFFVFPEGYLEDPSDFQGNELQTEFINQTSRPNILRVSVSEQEGEKKLFSLFLEDAFISFGELKSLMVARIASFKDADPEHRIKEADFKLRVRGAVVIDEETVAHQFAWGDKEIDINMVLPIVVESGLLTRHTSRLTRL